MKKAAALICLLFFAAGCMNEAENQVEVSAMKLTSPAFGNGGEIPSEYTCYGEGMIPELDIGDVPDGAKSLALIYDDPDAPAGVWNHWIVFNMPASTLTIQTGDEGTSGKNSWGRTGYGAPCPPSGTHRYFFKVYALDTMLGLKQGATKAELEKAMKGHIIGKAELYGKYSRLV